MSTHEINSTYVHGRAFSSNINGHRLISDSPADGSPGEGPSPKRLMLAALAGCTAIDVTSILEKMKVPFSDLSIRITAELTEGHPKVYKSVVIHYSIRMAENDRPKMEKAVKLSMERYCGVSAMFRSFARLEETIHFL